VHGTVTGTIEGSVAAALEPELAESRAGSLADFFHIEIEPSSG
jgi:hypothetical protein